MSFQYNEFGHTVTAHPSLAHAKLVRLFKKHAGATAEIARELGTTKVTLSRWVKRLVALGFKDPGDGKRRTARGKDVRPRQSRART
jgi:DNA-binding MarR family transcriptional regulator